jgi:hypothetical protein
MNMLTEKRIVTVARWAGRVLSVLLLGLMLFLAIGHIDGNGACNRIGNRIASEAKPDHLRDAMLGSALFTILAGLAIAWRWEGLGSLLIFGGMVAFAAVNGIGRTFMPNGPFPAFLITGVLFSFCWWRTHRHKRE